ncbi:21378_t:CDS:1, partial [Rhizophagus irregularis]
NFTVFVAEGAEAKYFAIKVDLSKAGAKVGDQGVLQGFYSGATNTLYGCADIKVVNFEVIGGAAKSDNKSSGASIISTFEVVFFTTILATFIIAL